VSGVVGVGCQKLGDKDIETSISWISDMAQSENERTRR